MNAEPVRCAYIILAHTQPPGIARLARTIVEQSPRAGVFIHYDAGAGAFPAAQIADLPRVALVARPARVSWGTFSQVDAVLRSLRAARADVEPFDWFVLLSGQDFPARPIADFESMLATSTTDAFMSYEPVAENRHFHDRYAFAYARISAGPLPRLLRARNLYDSVFNRMQPLIRLQSGPRGTFLGRRLRRSIFALGAPVYKGNQWWALARNAIDSVFATLESRPELIGCYRSTLIPDESFFQTIVINAPGIRTTNVALHYADWRPGNPSPLFLTLNDVSAIRASTQWFVRKVDAAADGGLRDALAAS